MSVENSIDEQPLRKQIQQYEIVTLFKVIEHISYPAPFLDHCLPLVKPGGCLVLSTITSICTSWLTTKVAAEDGWVWSRVGQMIGRSILTMRIQA